MKEKNKEQTIAAGGAGFGVFTIGGIFYGSSASTTTATLATIGFGSMVHGLIIISSLPIVTAGVAWLGYKIYRNKQEKRKI